MSKRMEELRKLIESKKLYSIAEAAGLVKQTAKAKFDETVEIHVRLGVDIKKSDQNVRGSVFLPYGTGKTKKVAVVAKGEKLKEAEASGADYFGDSDLVEKIQKGWLDFDVLVATPDTMKDLSKLGKILGPKGLMPNPKSGTVTFDVGRAVKELKQGRIEFKMDAQGIVHAPVGKVSFPEANLTENAGVLLAAIIAAKPKSAKGDYVKTISLSSTMGPGIPVHATTTSK